MSDEKPLREQYLDLVAETEAKRLEISRLARLGARIKDAVIEDEKRLSVMRAELLK
jgi:hypothetical protein